MKLAIKWVYCSLRLELQPERNGLMFSDGTAYNVHFDSLNVHKIPNFGGECFNGMFQLNGSKQFSVLFY